MREINGLLYRINYVESGRSEVIECENYKEMIEYVAKLSKRWIVTVNEIDLRTMRSPKVAIRNDPYYKELMKREK